MIVADSIDALFFLIWIKYISISIYMYLVLFLVLYYTLTVIVASYFLNLNLESRPDLLVFDRPFPQRIGALGHYRDHSGRHAGSKCRGKGFSITNLLRRDDRTFGVFDPHELDRSIELIRYLKQQLAGAAKGNTSTPICLGDFTEHSARCCSLGVHLRRLFQGKRDLSRLLFLLF